MTDVVDSPASVEMRQLVVRAHEGQRRNAGKLPYAAHVLSVAEIVGDAIAMAGEFQGKPDLQRDIYLAALGHDLYEDTTVSPEDIRARFGAVVDQLIDGMTNRAGDHEQRDYLARIGGADEEVRLIKVADLIDNVISCAYGIHDLGERWVRNTFLQIAESMFEVVCAAEYTRYPLTSALLLGWLDFAMLRLRANLSISRGLAPDPTEVANRAASKPWDGRLSLDTSAALRRTREREWREASLTPGARAFPLVWKRIRAR